MPSKAQSGDDDGGNDVETSKLGVLVPDEVQADNRALVRYRHDGSKRNKLGRETTERLTHGLAMYFWRNPSELEEVAQSEYVDDPEAFKQRIEQYQEDHLEDTLVVARELLHGTQSPSEANQSKSPLSEQQNKNEDPALTLGAGSVKKDRLGGFPHIEDAQQNNNIPQQERGYPREELEREVSQIVGREVRDQMRVFQRKYDERLSAIENAIDSLARQ